MSEDFIDHNQTDCQSVSITKNNEWNLRDKYSLFGWTEYEAKDDARYVNLLHISYFRPHKIAHKDELQLLQVNMESAINALSKAQMYKNFRSALFGGLVALLTAVFVGLALFLPHTYFSWLHVAVSGFFALCALLCLAIGIPRVILMRRREKRSLEELRAQTNDAIVAICIRAEALSGVDEQFAADEEYGADNEEEIS